MLPEPNRQLLTAFVDGELSSGDRRRVARLLRRSREARRLFRRLLRDSRALTALGAPPPLGVDLSGSVLQAISDRGLKPRRQPVRRAPDRYPAWVGVAAAAAVLVAVSFGSYFVFSTGSPSTPDHQAAVEPGKKSAPDPSPPRTGTGEEPEEELPPPSQVAREEHGKPLPKDSIHSLPHEPIVRVPAEEEPPAGPTEPEKKPEKSVLTSGGTEEVDRLERVELALPSVIRLDELEAAPGREKLAAQLAKGGGFRLEILCRDATKGVERFRSALNPRRVTLVVESTAAARLKKPQFRTDYALFFENVSAADLVEVLSRAGAEDRKAGAAKPGEAKLDGSVVYNPLSRWDRGELIELLGIDPVRTRPAERKGEAVDIHKPLSESTLAQVESVLDGTGRQRPGTGKAETAPANQALLMPLGSGRPRGPEVKRFLDTRKPARAGTLQVFLVLRNVG